MPFETVHPVQSFETLHDTFSIEKVIGSGGYGKVCLSVEVNNGAKYAIKLISDKDLSDRFMGWCDVREKKIPLEVLIQEPLRHKLLLDVKQLFFDEASKSWAFAMEYLDGFYSLKDAIKAQGPFSETAAKLVVKQLVDVLLYCVEQEIDHRDVKEGNILYNEETHEIRLIDFGAAQKLTYDAQFKTRGTPIYLPPEFYQTGVFYPLEATVWAVGCVAYALLAGQRPIRTKKDLKKYRGPHNLDEDLSSSSYRVDFIKECLELDPTERIPMLEIKSHAWLQD